MFKVRELKFHDIYLSVPYQGQQINCVLTTGIKDGSGLYVIVPGLFGDRTDSRHMFTRLSQAMAEKGYSVLRFDYIGGGSTQGDYSKNDLINFPSLSKWALLHLAKAEKLQYAL